MSTPGKGPIRMIRTKRDETQTIPRNEPIVPMAVLQPAGVPKAALPVAVVTKRTTAEEWMAEFTVPREKTVPSFFEQPDVVQ